MCCFAKKRLCSSLRSTSLREARTAHTIQVFSPWRNATPVKAMWHLLFASLTPASGCSELGMGFLLLGRGFSLFSDILAPSWIFNGRFWGMMARAKRDCMQWRLEGGWAIDSALPWAALKRAGAASLFIACGMSAGASTVAKRSCAIGCLEVLAWYLGASSSAEAFSASATTASAPKLYGMLCLLF